MHSACLVPHNTIQMVKEDECLRSWHCCFGMFMYLSHPACSRSVRKCVSTADRSYTTHRGRLSQQTFNGIMTSLQTSQGLPAYRGLLLGLRGDDGSDESATTSWARWAHFSTRRTTTTTEFSSCPRHVHDRYRRWNLSLQSAGGVHIIAGNWKKIK